VVGSRIHGQPWATVICSRSTIRLHSSIYPVEETVKKIFALPVPMEIRNQLAAVLLSGGLPGRGEQAAI
jgi:hypothetical protein